MEKKNQSFSFRRLAKQLFFLAICVLGLVAVIGYMSDPGQRQTVDRLLTVVQGEDSHVQTFTIQENGNNAKDLQILDISAYKKSLGSGAYSSITPSSSKSGVKEFIQIEESVSVVTPIESEKMSNSYVYRNQKNVQNWASLLSHPDNFARAKKYVEKFLPTSRSVKRNYGYSVAIHIGLGLYGSFANPEAGNHFGAHIDRTQKEYSDWSSYQANAQFLNTGDFAKLSALKPNQYKDVAWGLKERGYNDDPNLSTALVDIIETLNLDALENSSDMNLVQLGTDHSGDGYVIELIPHSSSQGAATAAVSGSRKSAKKEKRVEGFTIRNKDGKRADLRGDEILDIDAQGQPYVRVGKPSLNMSESNNTLQRGAHSILTGKSRFKSRTGKSKHFEKPVTFEDILPDTRIVLDNK